MSNLMNDAFEAMENGYSECPVLVITDKYGVFEKPLAWFVGQVRNAEAEEQRAFRFGTWQQLDAAKRNTMHAEMELRRALEAIWWY